MTAEPVDNPATAGDETLSTARLAVRDLGRMAYGPALAEQRRVNQAVIEGQAPPTVLLVEHAPVITLSQRKHVRAHLTASDDTLRRLGIEVCETDRGGDITYHGPGQLVAYPIVQLRPLGLNLTRYMRLLEQVVIETLDPFGIDGHTEPDATGVWVTDRTKRGSGDAPSGHAPTGPPSNAQVAPADSPASAKICAMGVRVRKNTTMHGLALNVNPDLSHFDTIVPCGLTGRAVTSMAQQLGETPTMETVKRELVASLDRAFRRQVEGSR